LIRLARLAIADRRRAILFLAIGIAILIT